jgi:two-component system sensor histidine kinase DesK
MTDVMVMTFVRGPHAMHVTSGLLPQSVPWTRSVNSKENVMTRLWTVFVLGWVLALLASGIFLVQADLGGLRLILALTILTALGGMYLLVTLREALGPGDLEPGGPSRSQIRRRVFYLTAMVLLVIGLVSLNRETESWWLIQHVVVAAGLALPAGIASWATGGATLVALLAGWSITGRWDPMLLILLAFGAAAIAIRQLTLTVAQLRVARDALARTAVDQERLRFARDLHDLLGHTLSVVVLKSELAGRLLPDSPALAASEIRDVERSARDALQQVRTAVAGYRQPVLARELDAARELLAAAGIDCSVEIAAGPYPGDADGLLAWAVREGVTNVIRHSRARRCEIRIARNTKWIELAITDDGHSPATGAPSAGSGLAGLRERGAAQGATLAAGPKPDGGFRLALRLPAGHLPAESSP